MLELPLLVVNIQRAGPSTGMPTKPEQADLLMMLYGRNGESPIPVVAAATPGDCFDAALEAARIALKYRTPVFLVSDAYLANGSEPWLIPDAADLPDISAEFATKPNDGDDVPARTCATPRRWRARGPCPARLGSSIGSAASRRRDRTGSISYDPDNHDLMVRMRAQKVAGIAKDIPELEVDHEEGADLLVLGWGGTYGPIAAAVRRIRKKGGKVAHAHLRHLNPFPRNTGDVLRSYDKVLIPEMNTGQLLQADPRRVPRGRGRLQQGARLPSGAEL